MADDFTQFYPLDHYVRYLETSRLAIDVVMFLTSGFATGTVVI